MLVVTPPSVRPPPHFKSATDCVCEGKLFPSNFIAYFLQVKKYWILIGWHKFRAFGPSRMKDSPFTNSSCDD